MPSHIFACPICRGTLAQTNTDFACESCFRSFEIIHGIPDFFVQESEADHIDEPNRRWLDPNIIQARNRAYGLGHRSLKLISEEECLALLIVRDKATERAKAITYYAKRRQRRNKGIMTVTEK